VILLLIAVLGWPLVEAIRMSFYSGLATKKTFVGLKQYERLLADPAYRIALLNTLKLTVIGVTAHFAVGFPAALMLNRIRRGKSLWRFLLVLPWFVPGAVVAVVWRLIFDTHFGVLNYVLQFLTIIGDPIPWLTSPVFALPAVIFAHTWRSYPFVMVTLFAGLQSVPLTNYEAAKVDGASRFQEFRYVTLPAMQYILLVTMTLDAIWTFKEFDLIQVLTGGGPLYFSEVLSTLVYKASFQNFDFGYGSAIAVSMLLISLVFTLLYARLLQKGKGVG
jgi:multiple sugar transport system permease protein